MFEVGVRIFSNSDCDWGKAEVPDFPDRPDNGNGYLVKRGPSISALGATYGRFRKSVFMTTGPTMRTTFGVCVPGASCLSATPDCFVPFVWAKRFENAPMPSSATKIPARQKTAAIKTRRLKKADCEVDFFFIGEVKLFPPAVNPRRQRKC